MSLTAEQVLDAVEVHYGADRCCWTATRELTHDPALRWAVEFALYDADSENEIAKAGAEGERFEIAALECLKRMGERGVDAPPLLAWLATRSAGPDHLEGER